MNWTIKTASEIAGIPLEDVKSWCRHDAFVPGAPQDGWRRFDVPDLLRLVVIRQLRSDNFAAGQAVRIGNSTKIRDIFREDYDAERNELTREYYLQVSVSGDLERGGSIYQFNLVEPAGGKVSMVDDITLEPLERVILINLNAAFADLKQRMEAYEG
jgi:DNA-binding transcriptional MerR regulator